jgi:putative ABC transport system substrate-binding protein
MHRIGILQLTQHLDDAVRGFKAGLALHGPAATFIHRNADGNVALLPGLAAELADQADLIFACSTPAAKAAVALPVPIPVVYTPVFDPVGAGLAASLARPGGRATGMAGMVPAAAKVAFISELVPAAVTVGLLYDGGDANAVLEAANFRAAAEDFTVWSIILSRSDHLSILDEKLVPRPDVLFLPIGRMVEDNFATVAYYADLAAVPVVASSPANVAAGALGALVADHYRLGFACAAQAAHILAGADPGALPVGTVDSPDVYLNAATARLLGLELSTALAARAREIYE